MLTEENLISVYTRKQAIEDGFQMALAGTDLDELRKEAGYKWPIYITNGVWSLVERAIENKKHCNDLKGVVWDILWMSRHGQTVNERLVSFQVIITGTGRKKIHDMYIEAGATDFDDSAPCLTIMLPEER